MSAIAGQKAETNPQNWVAKIKGSENPSLWLCSFVFNFFSYENWLTNGSGEFQRSYES